MFDKPIQYLDFLQFEVVQSSKATRSTLMQPNTPPLSNAGYICLSLLFDVFSEHFSIDLEKGTQ